MTVTKADFAQKIASVKPVSQVSTSLGTFTVPDATIRMFRVDGRHLTCVICVPVGLRGNWNIHRKRN